MEEKGGKRKGKLMKKRQWQTAENRNVRSINGESRNTVKLRYLIQFCSQKFKGSYLINLKPLLFLFFLPRKKNMCMF